MCAIIKFYSNISTFILFVRVNLHQLKLFELKTHFKKRKIHHCYCVLFISSDIKLSVAQVSCQMKLVFRFVLVLQLTLWTCECFSAGAEELRVLMRNKVQESGGQRTRGR